MKIHNLGGCYNLNMQSLRGAAARSSGLARLTPNSFHFSQGCDTLNSHREASVSLKIVIPGAFLSVSEHFSF